MGWPESLFGVFPKVEKPEQTFWPTYYDVLPSGKKMPFTVSPKGLTMNMTESLGCRAILQEIEERGTQQTAPLWITIGLAIMIFIVTALVIIAKEIKHKKQ